MIVEFYLLTTIIMAENVYDAIVVGSGISGGWAAKELTEKGLKTILLERGRNVEHRKDYVDAVKASWEFPHRGRTNNQIREGYPVLTRDRTRIGEGTSGSESLS